MAGLALFDLLPLFMYSKFEDIWPLVIWFWALIVPTVLLVWALHSGPLRSGWRFWMAKERAPMEVLDLRLAQGEINDTEYAKLREKLSQG